MAMVIKEGNVIVTRQELGEVIDAVENLGAHPRLTDIVMMLTELANGQRMSPQVNKNEPFKICEGVQCR